MANGGGNIYQTARKSAGLTQEAAAERLTVSLTSLRAYEGGERIPAGDVVARMCIVYNTQFLGLQHLQLFGNLLPECVREARPERFPTDVIKLVRRIMRFADGHRDDRLLEIAEDGVIDDEEWPEFLAITAELGEIVKAALALMYTEEV